MFSPLNWRELATLTDQIRPHIEGLFVDRLIIPTRTAFPDGYLKGEWALRLTGRQSEGTLFFSLRPRQPYISWAPGKGPQASMKATQSPFHQNLSKNLKGAKLLQVESISRDRSVILWFSEEGSTKTRLGLILVLIPAAPEAFLVRQQPGETAEHGWEILFRSRTVQEEKVRFFFPDTSKAPNDPPIRSELLAPEAFIKTLEQNLRSDAFLLRSQIAEKALKHLLKQAQDRLRQSETAHREATNEKDWQRWGDLLKGSIGADSNENQKSSRTVLDYMTGEEVTIPCDPKLSLKQQIEKYYQNSKRKQRRIEEAKSRSERFQETIDHLLKSLAQKPAGEDWILLEKWEQTAGISKEESTSPQTKKKSGPAWLGKIFISQDKMPIWVGRSKDENLELTFKHARGNDIWMHVRGRPGAHCVIPLPSGKSAPLQTLLDAAMLTLHYSGGQNWGKTEVDYTFKKYVKRIKDSTEASYTHNKTLLVEPDPVRLKKLLDQGN